jgi:hypothetical protein
VTGEKPFAHTVRPRQIAEECVQLAAGQSIAYAFEATAPVDFNIHFHKGDDVVYPVQRDQVQRGDERFTAASAGDYCLMWTNTTLQMVTVKGRLAPSPRPPRAGAARAIPSRARAFSP